MKARNTQLHLGVVACLVAAFLTLVAIPSWVSSPSNVRNIVLSPVFWPYVLAGATLVSGLGLLVAGWRQGPEPLPEGQGLPDDGARAGWTRLALLVVILVATFWALPRLGMVWTCMITFIITALLYRTRHPVLAVICAVVVPLLLYLFFAHVAGVGIPQGNFLRLP